ncbi:DUF433 domain-containing protein [Nostoc sp. JL33]|uniref:DUF433 domain-containing protein n=1 Tax=Nostoc sp. JL33 TaxID=2815396 RepID=UPI0025FE42DC|nr:DUF433 domain-containing protein [Nostoc sp. JL33]MBN3869149.1 DUF433 domain-containing protein [Nostoc sp. JL33]
MKLDRIISNPNRMNGQPSIRNLRLTVRRVIELLATYPNREELRQEFPELEDEDIQQALIFASSYLSDACGGQSQRIIELPNRYETVV